MYESMPKCHVYKNNPMKNYITDLFIDVDYGSRYTAENRDNIKNKDRFPLHGSSRKK